MDFDTTRASADDLVRKQYDKMDDAYWNGINDLIKKYNIQPKDIIQNYLAFMQRRDLPRLLAFYEIFQKIEHLPGSIAEIGVFKGSGLFTWGKLLETFCPGDRIRKVFGFDHFKGYDEFTSEDGISQDFVNTHEHKLEYNYDIIDTLNNLHNDDNLLKGVTRTVIINGDIKDTLPDFVKNSEGLRLSLLYLDVNLYEPTKLAIEQLYPLVVPGGVVAFTGYGQSPWGGEGKALEELFSTLDYTPKIHRFNYATLPSGYFIKEKVYL